MRYYLELTNGNINRYVGENNIIVWTISYAKLLKFEQLEQTQIDFIDLYPQHILKVCKLVNIDELCSI